MGSGLVGIESNGRSSYYNLLDDNPSHPMIVSSSRCFKRPMEEGTFLIAVSLNSNEIRLSAFPRFSGSLSSFEHPQRLTLLTNFKLKMVSGKCTRFLQLYNSNSTRSVKCSIDVGSVVIAIPLK